MNILDASESDLLLYTTLLHIGAESSLDASFMGVLVVQRACHRNKKL